MVKKPPPGGGGGRMAGPEPTKRMIEAGKLEFWQCTFGDDPGNVVSLIYKAMEAEKGA